MNEINEYLHNSQDLAFRSPFGACETGSQVRLAILAPGAKKVTLRLWEEGTGESLIEMEASREEAEPSQTRFATTLSIPSDPTLLFYSFIIETETETVYYGNNPESLGGVGQVYEQPDPPSFQITIYRKTPVPSWYKDGIVYQIFPDRFARSSSFDPEHAGTLPDVRGDVERCIEPDWDQLPVNEFGPDGDIVRWKFFGGSLDGIREKLGYLKELGVTVLYLNPIFRARSTHRYDTSNYMEIDPVLGDEAAFTKLAWEARAYGIRIILDGVFNHCGADSIYFDRFNQFYEEEGIKGAYYHLESPCRSWFTFYKKGTPSFRCWWNITDLPDFVTTNPEYVEFITGKDGVIRKWMRLGASGWRLDVADELPNSFLKEIRKAVKAEDPDGLLMGEVWDDPTNKHNYDCLMEYFWGEELDCTMNYPFRASVLPFVTGEQSAYEFCRRFMNLAENYPPENFYASLNLLGSHDRERVMNILGGYPIARYGFDHETKYHDLTPEQYELARKRYKMLSILQYMLPGVPDIYYGDETGVQGGSDPDCRRTYPWGREDQDLVEHFKWLGKFYHSHSCLKGGKFRLTAVNDDTLALERYDENERILLLVNRSDQYTDITYDGKPYLMWPFDGKIVLDL